MTTTARVYKIEMLIRNHRRVSFPTLLGELEVTTATLNRDLDYRKDQLGGAGVYDWPLSACSFGEARLGPIDELPGLLSVPMMRRVDSFSVCGSADRASVAMWAQTLRQHDAELPQRPAAWGRHRANFGDQS